MDRRIFLKASLTAGEVGLLAAAGLLAPRLLLAQWPTAAFHAETLDAAMAGLVGTADAEPSDQIRIGAPEPAENGAIVPLEIRSDLPETEAIYLFGAKNPFPAIAEFAITAQIEPYVSCRVKLGATGDLVVVVRAGGRLFSTRRAVEVVAGGCGA
jgi:sulfur-oxidizing protein SoxY